MNEDDDDAFALVDRVDRVDDVGGVGVDDGIDDGIVPAGFAVTIPKREEPVRLRPHTFEGLRHRPVIVRANGFVYRGVFVGCDEAELYLRGELRWWVLPLESVTAVSVDAERDADELP